ncbi:MAG: EAL domain-containing protein [Sulfuricurvum sp.]|nr:EAL domain-containing protein [Sulfuricurvum sp.]
MNKLRLNSLIQFDKNGILKPNNTIADALNIMSTDSISSIIITDKDEHPIGIFTEYDALKIIAKGIPITDELSTIMSNKLFTVPDSTYLHDAYILLADKGYRHLIVTNEENKYLGIVSEGDFIRHMGFEHLSKIQIIEQIMDRTPLMIEPGTSIQQVAKLMSEQHSDYAIVIENLKPVGIVHERTIAHYFTHVTNTQKTPIDTLISKEIYFVSKSILLQEAASLLTKHGTHQLIVINDDNQVIGLVERFDVLKAIHGSYFDFLIQTIEQKSEALAKLIEHKKLLTEQTNLLDLVINTIPDLVWLKDDQGTYITCNKMFERLYNVPHSELIGKNDFDFASPELAEFFREHDKMAMTADRPLHNEEYLIFADGSYEGMFDTIKTPIKDSDGNTFGVLGIARDITERKEKEEQLLQIDSELQAAEELAHVGSWTWDIKNNIFTGSEEACKIYGVPNFDQGGLERLLEIEHPDDRQMVKTKLLEGLQTGHYASTHRIVVDNEIRWISASAKFIKDKAGTYVKAQGMIQDITLQKMYEFELERLANYDILTGLANRTFLLSHLQKLIHRNQREEKNSAVLMFDLDHFRDVNDSFGHHIGDELLIQVAKRLENKIRKEDLISHLSGDEFILVLERMHTKEDAAHVAKEMIKVLSEPYILSNNVEVHIGVSVGIVILSREEVYPNELLQFADAALFKAKHEGRNCYRFYSDELTLSAQERIRYQNELFHALENNEFEMYYQPQVHIESNRIIGAEALIRWNHPERGLILPSVFIPIAEESGLIAHIGEWTLKESCKQGKKWSDLGYNFHLSVNVSLQQLRHQDLLKIVESILKESGFPAEKLVLELTESAMMKHEEELAIMLHSLRSKGISIAIDDFGTGYSSYSYLRHFPIDILKIDKSFIDDVPYKKDDTAIVKAIIAMSEVLGYQILAEGVEHSEQADFLKQQGCHYYQGFLKSRPVPAKQFEALLNR